jgi:hypothetical protein
MGIKGLQKNLNDNIPDTKGIASEIYSYLPY